jgi:predicted DNA-binding transcriptional regulator AlpA
VRERDHQRIEPRGLSRREAAEYIGVSPSLFDQLVKDGRMPQPKRINSRVLWDRHQIDRAFDNLPQTVDDNPWDDIAA